jgi:RNA polymerase sigma-32 factor
MRLPRTPETEQLASFLTVPAEGSSLSRYLEEIRRFPMLEPAEEFMLAKRWQEQGDTEAAHRLVTSHLRLVAKIAMGYRGYGLPLNEIISEGNVGLMQAVKRFDPDRGFRLATYAMWWIRAAIQEYILHSWSLVKMGTTAAQKKLFFNLRKLKGQMQAIDEGDLPPETVKEIAQRLDVTETEVVEMNRRLEGGDRSLNVPLRVDSETDWQDWLVDEGASQETQVVEADEFDHRMSLLHRAMGVLNERERHILTERRLKDEPTTLEELSGEYGISRERVRQIEVRAFEKLQRAIKALEAEQAANAVAALPRGQIGAEHHRAM